MYSTQEVRQALRQESNPKRNRSIVSRGKTSRVKPPAGMTGSLESSNSFGCLSVVKGSQPNVRRTYHF